MFVVKDIYGIDFQFPYGLREKKTYEGLHYIIILQELRRKKPRPEICDGSAHEPPNKWQPSEIWMWKKIILPPPIIINVLPPLKLLPTASGLSKLRAYICSKQTHILSAVRGWLHFHYDRSECKRAIVTGMRGKNISRQYHNLHLLETLGRVSCLLKHI